MVAGSGLTDDGYKLDTLDHVITATKTVISISDAPVRV
jgi:hypothetical protein